MATQIFQQAARKIAHFDHRLLRQGIKRTRGTFGHIAG